MENDEIALDQRIIPLLIRYFSHRLSAFNCRVGGRLESRPPNKTEDASPVYYARRRLSLSYAPRRLVCSFRCVH